MMYLAPVIQGFPSYPSHKTSVNNVIVIIEVQANRTVKYVKFAVLHDKLKEILYFASLLFLIFLTVNTSLEILQYFLEYFFHFCAINKMVQGYFPRTKSKLIPNGRTVNSTVKTRILVKHCCMPYVCGPYKGM